jgi:DNA polymerase-3 subunit epsilon
VKTDLTKQSQSLGVAAVLDVETTGLSPRIDEVLELALTLFRYNRLTGQVVEVFRTYSGLREPSCRISRAASQVHGITRPVVRGRRLDYRKIRVMAAQADFVVAHNARFDREFVEHLMPSFRRQTWLCSLYGIDWHAKGFTDCSLGPLAKAHGIEISRVHRALGDVNALLALLSSKSRGRRSRLFQLLRNADLVPSLSVKPCFR